MKMYITIATLLFCSLLAFGQSTLYYTCPMHKEIHQAKPGKCPKCGMILEKRKEKQTKPTVQKPTIKPTIEKSDTSGMNHGVHGQPKAEIKSNVQDQSISSKAYQPKIVRYDLYIGDTLVQFGKKQKRAIAVNGQIPMPTLTFTQGDTAEIYVHNNLDEETSLHWHGLFLPNEMDGVPYLTQLPIKPHSTYLYRFPIIQYGTHWYHSHSELQEQIGMYGAFIMNKQNESLIPTIPVVISEWTDWKPEQVHRKLKSATDWFAIRKGAVQSYSEAISQGYFKTKLANEWKRMNAMDVSDVYYDNFLINGKNQQDLSQFKKGEKVRLRIANAGASDYFWLNYAGGKITVVATDGNDVDPVEVDRLIIAVSETYDVVVTIPDSKSYEFLVTPEDRTGTASLWIGSGERVEAQKMGRLKYFEGMKMMNQMMDMHGNMIEMDGMRMQNQIMDMNTVMYPEIMDQSEMKEPMEGSTMDHSKHDNSQNGSTLTTLNYEMLKSTENSTLAKGPWRELKFDLTGNMNRYVWSLDNKVVSETDKIPIKKGENIRIILFNNSMMRHPMHLHGHDFRVLNGQGDFAPMKNIIDIMPMERDTIEFRASEPGGEWFFHCHILYHMMSGMGRVFSYENSPPNPALGNPEKARRKLFADDREFHFMGNAALETNGSDGEVMLMSTRWKVSSLWHLGFHDSHGYESESSIGRYLGRMQWWMPYVGFDYHYKKPGGPKNIFGSEETTWFGQTSSKLNRRTVTAGVAYTLPMLVIADARIDGYGKVRFQLSREDIPVSKRLRFNWMINTDKEYMAGFRYITSRYISISTHYDSDMGYGLGITFNY